MLGAREAYYGIVIKVYSFLHLLVENLMSQVLAVANTLAKSSQPSKKKMFLL